MKNYASKGKRIGLLLAMLFITSWMFAQVTVTGNIRDERDEGAIGATVLLVGSQKGTITDSEGNFKLSVPNAQTAVLQISYVGYETQTIPLKGKTRIRVILKEEANALNEVMVVAYGTQKKETLTGAISSVKTDVLLRSPNASIATSLAGQITGLSSVATSGQPGKEDPAIYIRGVGSLTESASAPLILVDGVERSFFQMDPNEIESVTVLKDASATAVFGVRGANGVILVTTRRGEEGKAKISISSSVGIQQPTRILEMADSYTYAQLFNEMNDNDKKPKHAFDEYTLERFRLGDDPIMYPNVNWRKYIMKSSSIQTQHNLNISGGTERVRYFISMGFLWQDGLFRQYKELDRQENRKEQLKEECERAKKEAECEQKNYEHAWAEYEMKYQKFLKEQAGILALTLEAGQPCPVCGSRDHPQITLLSDEAPTQAEVESAKEERDRKEKTRDIKVAAFRECLAGYQAAQEICQTLQMNIKDAPEDGFKTNWKKIMQNLGQTFAETEEQLKQLEQISEKCKALKKNQKQLAEQSVELERKERETDQCLTESKLVYTKVQAEYQTAKEKLPYETIEEAEKHLAQTVGALEQLRKNYETVTRRLTEMQNKEKELEGRSKIVKASALQSQKEAEKKKLRYEQVMKALGFADEESYHRKCMKETELEEAERWTEAYQRELQELEANRKLLEQQLKGKERKDIAQIKQEMKEASEVLEQIRREYMRLHNINEKNREIRDNLRRNFEKNSGLQNQYEIIGNLSKTANGNLSGSAKLDFETYIQRQYFRQIIRAANKRLIRMTSGEFILQCRDVEKLGSQGQAGLELDVYHMATDTIRDVKTLSGGESFMAALSMALGLSDIVQNTAGAIHLDTMFIDEGFGSLDDASRDQAIRVLNDLADKDRLVGIISHVNELKEQIDHKLVVKKTEKGSSVSWSV